MHTFVLVYMFTRVGYLFFCVSGFSLLHRLKKKFKQVNGKALMNSISFSFFYKFINYKFYKCTNLRKIYVGKTPTYVEMY